MRRFRKLTIDGDISDWPLAQFKKVAEQPVFPAGQNADSTTADGDHLVFDKTRIGLFNGTTTDAFQANDSDFGVTTYFAHDLRNLYILAVVIDDTLRDDNDTSQFGSSGFLNDGFEFFLDAKGDSTDCISDDAFPNIDQVEPNLDDFQVTVAINSTFKPAGSSTNVLGARQSVERAGNLDLIGPDKAGPGGIYRDQLDAGPGPDIAARKYDDLRAAGALNPELAAKPNVKFTGYAIEMRVPLRGKIPDVVANHAMGFEIFWRDVENLEDRAEVSEVIDAARRYPNSLVYLAGYVTDADTRQHHADATNLGDELVIQTARHLAAHGVDANRISGRGMGVNKTMGRAVVVSLDVTPRPAVSDLNPHQLVERDAAEQAPERLPSENRTPDRSLSACSTS